MSAPFLLARSWAGQHRVRTALVVAAIALATSLVVFTVSAYRAAIDRSASFAVDMMGPYEMVVMPRIAMQPTINNILEQQLIADPDIARVVRTQVVYGDIEDAKDTTYYDSWRAAFIATMDNSIPVPVATGRMPTTQTDCIEGVLSGGLAQRWRIGVGDDMPMTGPGGQRLLRIVGVTAELLSHNQASGVFITPAALRDLTAGTQATDRLYVDLRSQATTTATMARWRERFAAATPPVNGNDVQDFATELGTDKLIGNIRMMAGGAAIIVLLAALFIVYTAMAAGADERRRQLALLRAVGMTRLQVVMAVLLESLCLAALGCAVGVPLGWFMLQGLALAKPALFGGWITPDIGGLLVGVLVTCLSVLVAGILPAWAAGRVKPIEAMSLIAQQNATVGLGVRAIIAVITLISAIALFAIGQGGSVAMSIASTVSGLVLLAISLLVVVPVAIRICERVIGPLIARVFALPPALLQHQQGAHLARASGMLLTIAVCLGFSVIMNVWGRSMVTPFLPSPELPEQVISLLPGGVPPESAGEVALLPGLNPKRVLPLVAEQTMVGPQLMSMTKGGMDEIYVQIIGVDPQALAPGADSMLPIQSEGGDLTAQLAALNQPGACLVPSSFARRFNLQVGDKFPLMNCSGGSKPIDMQIVGLASLPGWQWITKMGRMRTLDGKPTAVLLMSPATMKLLGVESVRHWLADTTPNFDHAILRAQLQVLANKHAEKFESAHFGQGEQSRPSVKMIGTGEVARRMRARSDEVIWVLGAIPLAALIIAVLGVANAVAAGIRARRWEFGVLRAIGLERRHAQALILAETFIITTTAGVLCIVFGIITAWAAIDISLRLFNTGTGAPPLALPWLDIVIAWVITTVICLLAAIIPARRLAQATPLTLLQEGRATM